MPNETTKNKIVNVASKLFGRYGFYKTSMDEIARISRKAKGSLYYHFRGKEELYTEVVALEFHNLKSQLSPIVEEDHLKADKKIKKYLLKRMEVLHSASNYHETLKADFLEHFDFEFIDNLRNEMDVWEKEQIKQILLQGIREGVFAEPKRDINVLLDVFIMVLKGLEIPFFLQKKYGQYAPYFDDLLEILIKGVGK